MPILQQVAGRVLVVTVDEARARNALTRAIMTELRDTFEELARREPLPPAATDADIGPGGKHRPHVVVLRTTGEVFCAGAHLGEMKELGAADYEANLTAAREMGTMFRAVRDCPAPVVARVQGPCYGGGVGLVAACDVVVAGPAASFAFTEVRLGIVPGVIAPLVVSRLGPAATRTAFLSGAPLDAARAVEVALIDRLADADSGLDALLSRTVDELLAGGPAALGLAKELLAGVAAHGYEGSADLAAEMIARARTGDEGQAALAAFAARRPAPWKTETTWQLPVAEDTDREGTP